MENGTIVTKPALSDTELVTFKNIGTLESFNTDGLRSLLFTMSHIPNMKEKTLRYPGHVDLMKALISAGFLSKTTIAKNITPQTSIQISPLEFTSAILFDQWKLNPDDKEFTVMRIKVSDENKTLIYDLYDEYDPETKTSSMSRTTGYAACAAVELLRCEMWNAPGVYPPEIIGGDEQRFMYIINYLYTKGINYKETIIDRQF